MESDKSGWVPTAMPTPPYPVPVPVPTPHQPGWNPQGPQQPGWNVQPTQQPGWNVQPPQQPGWNQNQNRPYPSNTGYALKKSGGLNLKKSSEPRNNYDIYTFVLQAKRMNNSSLSLVSKDV